MIEGIEKRIKENYISTTLVTLNMTCMYVWLDMYRGKNKKVFDKLCYCIKLQLYTVCQNNSVAPYLGNECLLGLWKLQRDKYSKKMLS